MTPVCLTIAGSDPSGGAGAQADLKVFHQHNAFGTSVVTLVTAQNSDGVTAVELLDPSLVTAQLNAVLAEFTLGAVKTGALGSPDIIAALAEAAPMFNCPLVVDPVIRSTSGGSLLADDAQPALVRSLFPHTFLLTPNLDEAERFAEMPITSVEEMERAARRLALHGPKHVLIKGGHLRDEPIDVLYTEGELIRFPGVRLPTEGRHGTGCAFSAAIAANLAHGERLPDAVRKAKRFISEAIRTAPDIGGGYGPINFFAPTNGA